MTINPTPEVSCKYGAPMGRASHGAACPEYVWWSLQKIRLDSSGYDRGGAYWGIGQQLWYAGNEYVDRYLRAPTREKAKETVRAEFPNARFYR